MSLSTGIDFDYSLLKADGTVDLEWTRGTLNKQSLELFYSFTNYTGAIIGTMLIYSVIRSVDKKSYNSFVSLYCSGCILMSIPCASQCLYNLLGWSNEFRGGTIACELEAFFHVSAIMVQFIGVTLVAISFRQIIKKADEPLENVRVISLNQSYVISAITWIVAELGTFGFGRYSKIYVMPAGVFCFYDFGSPAIVFWFVPIMLIALGVIVYCYCDIFRISRKRERASNEFANQNDDRSMKLAKSSIMFVGIFFFGWIAAVVTCVYQLFVGDISQEFDTVVGIMGSLHSLLVPIVYGYHTKLLKRWLARYFPCCFTGYVRGRRKGGNGRETMVTRFANTDGMPGSSGPRSARSGRTGNKNRNSTSSRPGSRIVPSEGNVLKASPMMSITDHSRAVVLPQISYISSIHDLNKVPDSPPTHNSDLVYSGSSVLRTPSGYSASSSPQQSSTPVPRTPSPRNAALTDADTPPSSNSNFLQSPLDGQPRILHIRKPKPRWNTPPPHIKSKPSTVDSKVLKIIVQNSSISPSKSEKFTSSDDLPNIPSASSSSDDEFNHTSTPTSPLPEAIIFVHPKESTTLPMDG